MVSRSAQTAPSTAAALPAAPCAAGAGRRRAFMPGPPRRLGAPRELARWAPVGHAAVARAAPAAGAPVVAPGSRRDAGGHAQRRARSPRATSDRRRAGGSSVRLAVLPERQHRVGPARTALGGYGTVRTRLVVDRERAARRPSYREGRPVLRAPSASGAPAAPTPRGRVLRPQPAHPLSQPGVRAGRVRHQRPLARRDRLARRRLRRHPRHGPARPRARPRLARLHPPAQRRHPRAGAAMPVGTPVTIR